MKVLADTINGAEPAFAELQDFLKHAIAISSSLAPYEDTDEKLSQFVMRTAMKIKSNLVDDFAVSYPNISGLITNAMSEIPCTVRLENAVLKFGNVQKELYAHGCAIKAEEDRERLQKEMNKVIEHVVVFTIAAYHLYDFSEGVLMSVNKYCDRQGMSPDVVYGNLLRILKVVDGKWYSYEPLSPLRSALEDFDLSFMYECEEAYFPLTDEMTEELVAGKISMPEMTKKLLDFKAAAKYEDTDITVTTLISRMKLTD